MQSCPGGGELCGASNAHACQPCASIWGTQICSCMPACKKMQKATVRIVHCDGDSATAQDIASFVDSIVQSADLSARSLMPDAPEDTWCILLTTASLQDSHVLSTNHWMPVHLLPDDPIARDQFLQRHRIKGQRVLSHRAFARQLVAAGDDAELEEMVLCQLDQAMKRFDDMVSLSRKESRLL